MTGEPASFADHTQIEQQRESIQRARNHMLDVLDALRSISAEATSADLESDTDTATSPTASSASTTTPLVRARVNGEGKLVALDISPEAMRTPMSNVSRLVVAVASLAAARAAYAHGETMRKSGFTHTSSDTTHRADG